MSPQVLCSRFESGDLDLLHGAPRCPLLDQLGLAECDHCLGDVGSLAPLVARLRSYPPELRQRAVRMVAEVQGDYESPWAAMNAVAQKLGVR